MELDQPAAAICEALVLKSEAKALLSPGLGARAYLQRLVEHVLYADAVRFLALALAPRAAVWWACLCVRHSLGDAPAERQALRAAVELVREPSDDRKKACERAAWSAKLDTPAGLAALAASRWDDPPLRPGRPAGAAVLLSATRCPPVEQHFRQFVAIGLEVADGKLPWTPDQGRTK